ncbi:biotin-dependent carboxyltransferase family protein [Lysinibacillus sp. SGAir0095]|uniref:5-oxoprolinase subunit C family protein n=1 Tax=Lysinibacillus sp. SGAir0095 TaxID=2070463 RepID=UPI0010CCFE4B|nr:biotin-dependent carboxyltransferase family protein [Lysinibacillus sp. SGAir0095]QCR32805.1 KipI antagonist [Lysinibacillus sp. SGAir0095]
MGIKVIQPGLLATIQDNGRYGLQKYGIIVGGAMDTISLRIANLLVGNSQDEGALEVTLYGTSLSFESDELISITGGDLQPTVDEKVVPMWRPLLIRKGSVLKFNAAISGSRAYVSFCGGIQVPIVFNSKSTYLRAGIGGFQGRKLQKNDYFESGKRTELGEKLFHHLLNKPFNAFSWSVKYTSFVKFNKSKTIRIIRGSEYERFKEESIKNFLSTPYILSTQADRMGYRLSGEAIQLKEPFELLSEGVTYGTIQVPSNGHPIILMADRQTTGGYPKIGQVISADLPSLAQMQPTDIINFKEITLEEAQMALIEQEKQLNELSLGLHIKRYQLQ